MIYPEFDKEYIRIYEKENDERPFLRCHICQIVEVPDSVKLETIGGRTYPSNDWFFKVSDEWRTVKC